jgi:hypothetical protein
MTVVFSGSGSVFPSACGPPVKQAVAKLLESSKKWTPTLDRKSCHIEVQIILYDGGVLVEVPLIVQGSKQGGRNMRCPRAWFRVSGLGFRV